MAIMNIRIEVLCSRRLAPLKYLGQRLVPLLSFVLFVIGSVVVLADEWPNILWLTSEDNSVDWVGCYENPHAETPNIDKLAREGFQYMHCYANAPVCAPSRSTWITGIHAISMGTHPMRSRNPIPHDRIAYYPDLLKKAGYFVGNANKTDYNIGGRDDKSPWDTDRVEWKTLKAKQPFFMVINHTQSHESSAFGDVNATTHSPDKVRLAKYHPDIPTIRQNYAHYHDQVKKMDAVIGESLAQLEKMGLADNTIVVYNSDHGGVIARSKRYHYNSGTHCPLVIRIPEKFKHLRPGQPGSKVDTLVSFIDMTKTWLHLCGAETPDYLQGKVFLGPDAESREYHVSFSFRMDERSDNVRAIRDRRFLYIRNYMPYAPYGQRLLYLWQMQATQAWQQHHLEGKTDAITGRFFETKPSEELYDTSVDCDCVHNFIDDPNYKAEVTRLSQALDQWQVEHFDAGLLPETELLNRSREKSKTIYDLVRDPRLYDLIAYQQASALSLGRDPANLAKLYDNLKHQDSGVRYWGMVGLLLLPQDASVDADTIQKHLSDESHHVRALAAWVLYRRGDHASAQACWNQLLRENSYASLEIMNIIDWIGDGVDPYVDAIKACNYDHEGYVLRMKQNLGVEPETNSAK
jgi:N-sulfoglucosamine sulfohydrolase